MFFPSEWDYFESRGFALSTLTGIWCAKEAVVKAIYPSMPLSVREVEILGQKGAPPIVVLHALHSNMVPASYKIKVSIAHTADYATATAIHWVE